MPRGSRIHKSAIVLGAGLLAFGTLITETPADTAERPQDWVISEVEDGQLNISSEFGTYSAVQQANPDAVIEPNARVQAAAATFTPRDPYYATSWWLKAPPGIEVAPAWRTTRGAGIVIAVLDSGLRTESGEFVGRVLPGYDFVRSSWGISPGDGDDEDSDPTDPGDNCGDANSSIWHGTHVAGIATAAANGVGTVGVAPEAMVLPVRVLGHCGGEIPQVAKGILWAAGLPVENAPLNPNPADVINLSLVAPIPCYFALEDAITRAIAAGAVVVASAGNQSLDAERAAPANCGGVITVAAGSTTGTTSSYSNYGSLVEVVAPGDGIYSTVDLGYQSPSGQPGYAPYWGTSMAAPMVSGLAALYLAAHPGATVAETVAAIIASATPIASCVEPFTCGAGLVSAARLIPPPPPFVSPTDFAIVADPLMAKVLESALSAHRGKLLPVGRGDLRVVVNDCVLTPPMSIEEGFEQLLSGAVCAPAAVSAG